MKYKGTLLAVKNMEKAKAFYKSVLGLEVVMDAGANVELTGGIFLQTTDTWVDFIHCSSSDIIFKNNAIELYFETDDMDAFMINIEKFSNITYIHPLITHSWGQRAVRFYDLDNHIVEVAENIAMVIRRFIASGFTVEETARRMDVPAEWIQSALE